MFSKYAKPKRSDRKDRNQERLNRREVKQNFINYVSKPDSNQMVNAPVYQNPIQNKTTSRDLFGKRPIDNLKQDVFQPNPIEPSKYVQKTNPFQGAISSNRRSVVENNPSYLMNDPSNNFDEVLLNDVSIDSDDSSDMNQYPSNNVFQNRVPHTQSMHFSKMIMQMMNKNYLIVDNKYRDATQDDLCLFNIGDEVARGAQSKTIFDNLSILIDRYIRKCDMHLDTKKREKGLLNELLNNVNSFVKGNIINNSLSQKIRDYDQSINEYVQISQDASTKYKTYLKFVNQKIEETKSSRINSLLNHFEQNKQYFSKIMDKIEPININMRICLENTSIKIMNILRHIESVFQANKIQIPQDIRKTINSLESSNEELNRIFLLSRQFDYSISIRPDLEQNLTNLSIHLHKVFERVGKVRKYIIKEFEEASSCVQNMFDVKMNQDVLSQMKQMTHGKFTETQETSSKFSTTMNVLNYMDQGRHPFEKNIEKIIDVSLIDHRNIGTDSFKKTWDVINKRKHSLNEKMIRLYYQIINNILLEFDRMHLENKQFVDLMQQLTNV